MHAVCHKAGLDYSKPSQSPPMLHVGQEGLPSAAGALFNLQGKYLNKEGRRRFAGAKQLTESGLLGFKPIEPKALDPLSPKPCKNPEP